MIRRKKQMIKRMIQHVAEFLGFPHDGSRQRLTKENVEASLQSLGNDKNEVAETLRRSQIQGSKSTSFSCPIARYVEDRFYAGHFVSVGLDRMVVERLDECVALPKAVRDFIKAFDAGEYPDLVEPGPLPGTYPAPN